MKTRSKTKRSRMMWVCLLVLMAGAGALIFFQKHAAVPIYDITMTSNGYSPSTLNIPVGAQVVFHNADTVAHWPASNIHPTHDIYPEFDPKKAIAPGDTWQFSFTKAGTWRMHDHLNPLQGGVISVAPASGEKTQRSAPRLWSEIMRSFSANQKEVALPAVTQHDERIFSQEAVLQAYLQTYGPTQTIHELHALESKFGSCHQPAHRAGHIGYQILGEKALNEYSPECQSGYYHGVMEAYFKEHGAEDLKSSLDSLCPSNQNSFFDHQCVHGIGHGLLAWTNYELPEALKACDQLPRRQDSCWTGAFMENLSAQIIKDANLATVPIGESDVHITKYLNEDPLYPCNGVDAQYQNSCYFLQTSRMLQIFGQDFEKIADACGRAPAIHQSSCFASMGRDVGGRLTADTQAQIKACGSIQNETYKIQCLNGAVQNSFWDPSGQTAARTFCQLLQDSNEKQGCYLTIFERAGQLMNTSAELEQFCTPIETTYKNQCAQKLLPSTSH